MLIYPTYVCIYVHNNTFFHQFLYVVLCLPQIIISRKSHVGKQKKHLFVFQENYERMKVLVDELKNRTEKIKLGRCKHYTLQVL